MTNTACFVFNFRSSMFYGCCCVYFKEIISELCMFKAVMHSVMMNVCTSLTAGSAILIFRMIVICKAFFLV